MQCMNRPPKNRIVDSQPEGVSGEVREVSADEVEAALLAQLEAAKDDPSEAMWELAQFYKLARKLDLAMAHFRSILGRTENVDAAAQILMAMGQTAELSDDFEMAEQFYRTALSLDAGNEHTRYFMRNNLGYSLNRLGRHLEAEPLCRQAIEIAPRRANAHKNLGLSLQGQGRFREAGSAFVAAMRANPGDPRAFRHLKELVANQPGLADEFREAIAEMGVRPDHRES
jgi:tetratricopeptide (TPR) repeat protein